MKKLLALLIGSILVLGAGQAFAQDDDGSVPTRFYDFNDMLIDGEFMRPEGMMTRARDSARFERLLDLRREFLEEIEESAKEEELE
jgi:hypothetical protein